MGNSYLFLTVLHLCSTWPLLVTAMQPLLPTHTFAGLRAAQTDLGMKPTPTPWSQAELSKRLSRFSEDPAICGWVEGDQNNTVSCNSGYTCAATSTFVGCCSTGAVGCQALFTACHGRGDPSCTGACLLNSANLLCEGRAPYCATYQYDQGSRGYGCAAVTGYNKTVLTTANPGFTPFGQITSSSPSSSPTSDVAPSLASEAASPSPSSTNLTLISGGAIAGAVAGSILVLAIIVGIIYFFWRRHSKRKEQERQAATIMSERRESQYVYAQYAKADASTLSPPMSPPMHSRQPSDQTYGFATSPPLSENGRPWSPESVNLRDEPAELAADEEDTRVPKR